MSYGLGVPFGLNRAIPWAANRTRDFLADADVPGIAAAAATYYSGGSTVPAYYAAGRLLQSGARWTKGSSSFSRGRFSSYRRSYTPRFVRRSNYSFRRRFTRPRFSSRGFHRARIFYPPRRNWRV